MRWTTADIRYLEEHAAEGADAIAEALGCTREAVRQQAKNYGVSLRMRWVCPNCGATVYKPLSARTGWCEVCTRRLRIDQLEDQVRQMQDQQRLMAETERKRQAIYSKKHRIKKKGFGVKTEKTTRKRHPKP